MTKLSLSLSVVTLNINGLNSPLKRQINRMDKNTYPSYMLSKRSSLQIQNTNRLKVKRWEKILHANSKPKESMGSYTNIRLKIKMDFKVTQLISGRPRFS